MRNLIILALCILTLPAIAQKKINAEEIIDKINNGEAVEIKDAVITGDLDFRMLKDIERVDKLEIIGKDNPRYHCHVRVPLKFENCKFLGDVIGYYSSDHPDELYIAVFHEDVVFKGCNFDEDFYVKYSPFYELADFTANTFEETALFKYAEFSGDVSFKDCKFYEEANFKYAEFPGEADFSDNLFDEEANFKYTKFAEEASFKNSKFYDYASFKYTKIRGFIDFSDVEFKGEVSFKYIKFIEGVSFENTYFDRFADFKYAEFDEPLSLNNLTFDSDVSLKYAKVNGVSFMSYILREKDIEW